MGIERRNVLGGLAAGAAGMLLASGRAEAVNRFGTTSILLFHRTTGAWRVFVPASVTAAGTSVAGTDSARFGGVVAAAGVTRAIGFSPAVVHSGLLALRGSATTTSSWEVSGLEGSRWVRRNGGALTWNGARWIPTGIVLDEEDNRRLTLIGPQQTASLRLDLANISANSFRLAVGRVVPGAPVVDTRFAFTTTVLNQPYVYAMLVGSTLAQFYNGDAPGAPAPSLDLRWTLATVRGHVYGPVSTDLGWLLLVYDPTSGLADFVLLDPAAAYAPTRIVLRTRLAVGWSHVVPFRYGWFFYHRTRRLAQMATVRRSVINPTAARLVNGYLWPDNTLGDFTDAAGVS